MKSRFGFLLAAAFVVAAGAMQAADGYSFRAPVLGYVVDSEEGALHRVDGMLGAARVGDRLALDFPVARAQVASAQNVAIVADNEGRIYLVDLSASPPTVREFVGAMAADRMVISPQGRSAALYSADSGRIQFLDISGTAAQIGKTMELPQGVGDWTAFAVSDRGILLAAAAQASGGALYALRSGGQAIRVGAVNRAEDLAFFAGSDNAVIADRGANEVHLLRGILSWRRSTVIATELDGIVNPFGVEVTADGRFVAVAIPGGFASIPVLGGAVTITRCGCTPTELAPLAGGDTFRLTADLYAPIRVARVGMESNVRFIPALVRDETLDSDAAPNK